jgi:predicted nucleic acid-binding protein
VSTAFHALLFGKLIVPFQVEQELERGRKLGHDVPDLHQSWIEIRRAAADHSYAELGPGESGALDLARTLLNALVILGDGTART